ncbi:MAG: class I SAM-dependent methyltransferase [Solirubrobacterales bacterium]|nr:class I SAM-dependent methyltransferase [Solirubrobacterales bacterium]
MVDLATGTGLLLRALAARGPRPATATGVDRSAGMLAQVGRLPDEWRVIHGDARCVPLPDGAADVVTCCYLLHTIGGRLLNGVLPRLAAASPRRWGGLMALDPMAELGPAGLVATHRVVLPRGGYPSLVVRARVA